MRRFERNLAEGKIGESIVLRAGAGRPHSRPPIFSGPFTTDERCGWLGVAGSFSAAGSGYRPAPSGRRHGTACPGGRPNLFIKIPGTKEGLPAIEEAIFAGMPINVTLLFSREQYLGGGRSVPARYRTAHRGRAQPGCQLRGLGLHQPLGRSRGRQSSGGTEQPARHRHRRADIQSVPRICWNSPRWQRIFNAGARPQRLLWASTGTKDPKASDILYIKALAAPFTVNTMPEATLKALADHGEIGPIMAADGGDCEVVLEQFAQAGIEVDALAARLQDEGAKSFVKSWNELMAVIASKSDALKKAA